MCLLLRWSLPLTAIRLSDLIQEELKHESEYITRYENLIYNFPEFAIILGKIGASNIPNYLRKEGV